MDNNLSRRESRLKTRRPDEFLRSQLCRDRIGDLFSLQRRNSDEPCAQFLILANSMSSLKILLRKGYDDILSLLKLVNIPSTCQIVLQRPLLMTDGTHGIKFLLQMMENASGMSEI